MFRTENIEGEVVDVFFEVSEISVHISVTQDTDFTLQLHDKRQFYFRASIHMTEEENNRLLTCFTVSSFKQSLMNALLEHPGC